MKLRITLLGISIAAIGAMYLVGCSREQPASPSVRPQSPSAAHTQARPGALEQPENPTAEPTTPSATAPISMKPTDVHPTMSPPSSTKLDSGAANVATPTGAKPPENPKVAVFAGLTAPKPATWVWQQPIRQFALAEYAVPGRDGTDQAHITVSKAGGTIDDNVARWKTQFRNADGSPVEPKLQRLEADGMAVTVVEFAGEYRGMGMPAFTPDQLFITGIVQTSSEQVFIRFVGPTATVENNREAFMDMLRGLKKTEPQK